jgi:hypothetical protein
VGKHNKEFHVKDRGISEKTKLRQMSGKKALGEETGRN